MVVVWYILTEMGSILENAVKMGAPVPTFLKRALELTLDAVNASGEKAYHDGSVSYKTEINKPRPKSEWYRVENTHEPIIDRSLWNKVQSMIAQRAKPFDCGTAGPFPKKPICAGCGYTI